MSEEQDDIKYIYIASPYTVGDQATNVRKSILIAEGLVAIGYIPYLPLLDHFWHFMSPHDYEYWFNLSVEWLKKCDAVLRLKGESSGADKEVELAIQLGKKIFYSASEIPSRQDKELVK